MILNYFLSLSLLAVAEVKLKDSQYTLDHMKAFGMYNYLHADPWYEESVYFIDCKGRVLSLKVTLVSLSTPCNDERSAGRMWRKHDTQIPGTCC